MRTRRSALLIPGLFFAAPLRDSFRSSSSERRWRAIPEKSRRRRRSFDRRSNKCQNCLTRPSGRILNNAKENQYKDGAS